jgi:homoserine O-acetyltransferase/O-succinyltransferase
MFKILKKSNHIEGVYAVTELKNRFAQASSNFQNMKILSSEKPFALECGEVLPALEIAYHSYGTLNEKGDNAVWVCHALTGNSDAADWWSGLVGKGKLLDPTHHFIVCANMLGSHYGSTSALSRDPNSQQFYGREFPIITIRDVVNAHQILAQHLGITKIELALGGSMGGQQVLEWAISAPKFFKKIVVVAAGAQMSAWSIGLNEAQRMAIEADSSISVENLKKITTLEQLAKAGEKGLEAARAIGMLSYRTYEGYNIAQGDDSETKFTDFKVSSYQRYQGLKLKNRFSALAYLSLSKTMDSHNVGRNRGGIARALQQIEAETLVIGIQSDLLFPLSEQVTLAAHIPNARLELIYSKFGHDGFLIEFDQMNKLLKNFLGAHFIHQQLESA